MATLIDSSIFIELERHGDGLGALTEVLLNHDVALAAITAAELLEGVQRARTAAQRQSREAFVERILAVMPVIPFDLPAARIYAQIKTELELAGTKIGAHDLQLAAIALANKHVVLTANAREFSRVPDLAVHAVSF